MKKKLIITILGTVITSLLVVTLLFVAVINYEYENNTRNNLMNYNSFVVDIINSNSFNVNSTIYQNLFKEAQIRTTFIDGKGKVIYDSVNDSESMDNHNNRKEIIDAKQYRQGYSIRYSNTMKKNMMYYATQINSDFIVRSSMPMDIVNKFERNYIKYYFIITLLVIAISILISLKLSYNILRPINELHLITNNYTKGELNQRIHITSKDEIGQLGNAFNTMADKLQSTISEVVDKQNTLGAILKSMDSGVIAVDENKRIILLNPYAQQIFGVNSKFLGKNLLDVIRNYQIEEIFDSEIKDSKEVKLNWPKERDLKIKTASIIKDNTKFGTVAVVQDITDIKKLENMRTQFVANVSHELKTPLTSIKGFAETLRYVEDSEKKDKFLNIIDEEADRLTRLINDILSLSDIEQHKELKDEIIDVEKDINEVYEILRFSAEEKNISITFEIEKVPYLKGDNDKFKQILINLLDNAIKYCENGDRIYISVKREDKFCIISVKDTGPGIPEENLPRIFERFYRVDKARSRKQGGTGLGLAIVKHIVISFNGSIDVESKVGEGSIFTLKIPYIA